MAKIITLEEYNKRYWYKTELIKLCSELGLSSHGTKAELQECIQIFLKTGQKNSPHNRLEKNRTRLSKSLSSISLTTRLIPDGFKFNHVSRQFFADYFGVKKFSFTKEMAQALREAEKHSDTDMTVKNLIEVYKTTQSQKRKGIFKSEGPEEKTYQWNQFVKDFSKDPKTSQLPNKLKIAAELWKIIRESSRPKRFSSTVKISLKTLERQNSTQWHDHENETDIVVCTDGKVEVQCQKPRQNVTLIQNQLFTIKPKIMHRVVNIFQGQSTYFLIKDFGDSDEFS